MSPRERAEAARERSRARRWSIGLLLALAAVGFIAAYAVHLSHNGWNPDRPWHARSAR